jgi:hypothetical protein
VIYDLVGKVVVTSGDYTEYTTLQYLAGREPKIPAPKPHGLIRTGGICIIFGSYILSMMLTKAWPMRTLFKETTTISNALKEKESRTTQTDQ